MRTESPVQEILIDGIDFAGVLVLEAIALGRRCGIWVIDEDIDRNDKEQSDSSCARVGNGDLGPSTRDIRLYA